MNSKLDNSQPINLPTRCNRTDCPNPTAPTGRFNLLLHLYSWSPIIDPPVTVKLATQVCKDCKEKVKVEDLVTGNEGQLAFVFKNCTQGTGEPQWGARRQLDVTRSRLGFERVGGGGGVYREPEPRPEPELEPTPTP